MDCKFPLYNVKTLFQYREGRDAMLSLVFLSQSPYLPPAPPVSGTLQALPDLAHSREHRRRAAGCGRSLALQGSYCLQPKR